MSADFAWVVEHSAASFSKYAAKRIAVHDGRVIGVGETATEEADEIIAQADRALPATKRASKNRIVLAGGKECDSPASVDPAAARHGQA